MVIVSDWKRYRKLKSDHTSKWYMHNPETAKNSQGY